MEWIYKRNSDNSTRFVLGEYNTYEDKTLICMGINPSTAEPNNLDNTLRVVKSLAGKRGYINWVMINVYPQRATNTHDLHHKCDAQLHSKNLAEIKNLLADFCNADILFAYGNLIDKRPYLIKCLGDIMEVIDSAPFSGGRYCLKLTQDGNPAHPLYQKTNLPFMSCDI